MSVLLKDQKLGKIKKKLTPVIFNWMPLKQSTSPCGLVPWWSQFFDSGFQNIQKSYHTVIHKMCLYRNLTSYEDVSLRAWWAELQGNACLEDFSMHNKLKIECNLKRGFLNMKFLT